MEDYIFVMGRTPDLAYEEIVSLYPQSQRITTEIVRIRLPENTSPRQAISSLGGTTKIGLVQGTIKELTAKTLSDFLHKIIDLKTFGISIYGGAILPRKTRKDMKDILRLSRGRVEYVESPGDTNLSSVVIAKKNVHELLIVSHNGEYVIAKTCAVQDFADWSFRDYSRPFADAKTGMLPPKVARMVVNIVCRNQRGLTLLDPFCGMGTIVAEILLRDCHAIGSDVSKNTIMKAQNNILWLYNKYLVQSNLSYRLLACDATRISSSIVHHMVDAIVTEPFMGRHDLSMYPEKIPNTIRGLEKLYIGCFRDWKKVLKQGGKVMISLPSYIIGRREVAVKKSIDKCEILGYTKLFGPIEYAREKAFVRRNFYLLSSN